MDSTKIEAHIEEVSEPMEAYGSPDLPMEAQPEPEDEEPSLLKPKKARSAKQIEAFKKCQEARKSKLKSNKSAPIPIKPVIIDRETEKGNHISAEKERMAPNRKKKRRGKATKVVYYGSSSEDESPNIVYVPKPNNRRQKPTRVQFFDDQEPDYYSDEDEEDLASYNNSFAEPEQQQQQEQQQQHYYTQRFV